MVTTEQFTYKVGAPELDEILRRIGVGLRAESSDILAEVLPTSMQVLLNALDRIEEVGPPAAEEALRGV